MIEQNGVLKFGQLGRARLVLNLAVVVEIFEDLLRCAQRLLENIMNAGEPLDRLLKHQQRNDEAGEFAGGQRSVLDLQARVGEEPDDRDRGEEFD